MLTHLRHLPNLLKEITEDRCIYVLIPSFLCNGGWEEEECLSVYHRVLGKENIYSHLLMKRFDLIYCFPWMRSERRGFSWIHCPCQNGQLESTRLLLDNLAYQWHHSAHVHRFLLRLLQSLALLGESLKHFGWFKARSLGQAYRICQSLGKR